MSTALIDYNMGNLGSVAKALEFVGASARVVASGQELRGFDCYILPGVGNFGDGMENLRQRGFDRAIFLRFTLSIYIYNKERESARGFCGRNFFLCRIYYFFAFICPRRSRRRADRPPRARKP